MPRPPGPPGDLARQPAPPNAGVLQELPSLPAPHPIDILDVPAGSDEVLPAADPASVLRESALGLGLVAVATGVALVSDALLGGGPAPLSTVRLALVTAGVTAAGHAVSRRAGLPLAWAAAALAGFLAALVAVPAHWDSLRLLLWVGGAAAAVGALLALAPPRVRYPAVVGLVAVHFGGILCAVTSPDPSPWLSSAVGSRFYVHYLQFMYLRNAYHFYSPEPGPANLLLALVEYELDEADPATGRKKSVSEWHTMPRRGAQTTDPLGISYYRRLSLTEYSARSQPDAGAQSAEVRGAWEDRNAVAAGSSRGQKKIPHPPEGGPHHYEARARWYQQPSPEASRYVLPSYARHITAEYTAPGRKVVNVKLYRVEHRIVTAHLFVTLDYDPYHPSLFRVYFLGDYKPDGILKDPRDPMLYWIIPVLAKKHTPPYQDWAPDDFHDYLTEHAGTCSTGGPCGHESTQPVQPRPELLVRPRRPHDPRVHPHRLRLFGAVHALRVHAGPEELPRRGRLVRPADREPRPA